MQINLVSKNITLTEDIKDYAEKRITNLEKLLSGIEEKGGKVMVNLEVSKVTKHHKLGEIFHADCLIIIDGKKFYGKADKEDFYQAVDAVKNNLYNEINKNKTREKTLSRRGASKIKKMLKGLSGRDPSDSE